ncbi:hypothetical protein ACP3W2_25180, partial [Salmonella enterica]|uniref:hypothetical protein n=1 Tax=Salmonella enterica TaxID=28901 RepID=UPI003CE90500
KMAKKIDKMSIDKLAGVYSVASELFNEYTRMCDGYMLSTGDRLLQNLTPEANAMIKERQKLLAIKETLREKLKKKLEDLVYEKD